MNYKAVIADVDGTLFPPSEVPSPKPSESLIEAVKKVQDLGVFFSIASGRSLPWVREIINGFNLHSPIILDNGAKIYDCSKKEYIWESYMAKNTAQKIVHELTADKSLNVIVADGEERVIDPLKIINWKISKILVLGVTPQKAEDLCQNLKRFSDIHVTRSISGTGEKSQSVHITNFNATKQTAVAKLLDFLRITQDEVVGIGDSYNDFPLLMACGLKVAMGNAVEDLKAIADYIAPSYEEEGVKNVLEKFVLK